MQIQRLDFFSRKKHANDFISAPFCLSADLNLVPKRVVFHFLLIITQ